MGRYSKCTLVSQSSSTVCQNTFRAESASVHHNTHLGAMVRGMEAPERRRPWERWRNERRCRTTRSDKEISSNLLTTTPYGTQFSRPFVPWYSATPWTTHVGYSKLAYHTSTGICDQYQSSDSKSDPKCYVHTASEGAKCLVLIYMVRHIRKWQPIRN